MILTVSSLWIFEEWDDDVFYGDANEDIRKYKSAVVLKWLDISIMKERIEKTDGSNNDDNNKDERQHPVQHNPFHFSVCAWCIILLI